MSGFSLTKHIIEEAKKNFELEIHDQKVSNSYKGAVLHGIELVENAYLRLKEDFHDDPQSLRQVWEEEHEQAIERFKIYCISKDMGIYFTGCIAFSEDEARLLCKKYNKMNKGSDKQFVYRPIDISIQEVIDYEIDRQVAAD